jgi:poly(A) polymerase
VKFGTKTIEVATFRRQIEAAGITPEAEAALQVPGEAPSEADMLVVDEDLGNRLEFEAPPRRRRRPEDHLIQRDNTYGTPEEDAFRRDFTVNALFYDIGTFSIIDYTGGLKDLDARLIRSIGEPEVRFLEDPVRMLRAVVLAARLEFTIDEASLDAIEHHRHEIRRSAAPRLLEEYYKILRSGHSAEAFRQLSGTGLLREITPELEDAPDAFWHALEAIDRYREPFDSAPDSLTNAVLAGTLLHPLGLVGRRTRFHADALERKIELGLLPIARRDVERLQQIFSMIPRALDIDAPVRSQRALLQRPSLDEALTWLEIHGDRPDVVEHWRALRTEHAEDAPPAAAGGPEDYRPLRRRRRRRPRRNPSF